MLDFLTFVSQEWLLVSLFMLMLYAYIWRESRQGGKRITHHELTRLVNADAALVVDIRDAKEFSAGHIAGSINIPYSKIKDQLRDLESHRDKTIVLVDKYGQQTGAAGRSLAGAAFKPARLQGGLADWQMNNLPVIRGK